MPAYHSTAQRGFSLMELLVVISIIAILASMLLPAVGLVRDSARSTECASRLRQVAMAVLAYAQDHDGVIPPALRSAWPVMGWSFWNWRGAIEQGGYLDNAQAAGGGNYVKVLGCPVQQRALPGGFLVNPVPTLINTSGWATYGANGHLTTTAFAPVQPDIGTPLSQIGMASSVLLASDGHWTINNYNPTVYGNFAGNLPETPHRGRANTVHLDGHVSSQTAVWLIANVPNWATAGSPARDFWRGSL